MQPLPKISVIIPSFNQGQFIERTILSILDQDYEAKEIIVIDGCSSDETVSILEKYSSQISHWVSEPDRGQSHAINKGFDRASGELVAWQNSDDFYYPNAFQVVGRLWSQQASNTTGLVSGNVNFVDKLGEIESVSKFWKTNFNRVFYEGFVLSSQGVFFSREAIRSVGRFDESLTHAMDFEIYLRVLEKFDSLFTKETLGAFSRYEGTKTNDTGHLGLEQVNTIRERYSRPQAGSFRFEFQKQIFRMLRLSLHYSALKRE